MQIVQNEALAKYTSWQIGGPAEHFCQPTSLDELKGAIEFAKQQKLQVTVLGGGSNVLIGDLGIRGLVICMRKFVGVEDNSVRDGRLEIVCLAGTSKSELLRIFLKNKLSPALFLAGLPGDVGGGVVMNAGVAESFVPREFVEIVDWVELLDCDTLQITRKQKSELKWSYRHCEGLKPHIITRVKLSWPDQKDDSVLDKVREANKVRLTKQPLDMPSCGSVFVNPPGYKAAQLIDQSGLKGYQVGGAQVSLKHANFIVNLGGATAADVLAVITHVQKTVEAKSGVLLKTEVIQLGKS